MLGDTEMAGVVVNLVIPSAAPAYLKVEIFDACPNTSRVAATSWLAFSDSGE
jgi:hypothetical protein